MSMFNRFFPLGCSHDRIDAEGFTSEIDRFGKEIERSIQWAAAAGGERSWSGAFSRTNSVLPGAITVGGGSFSKRKKSPGTVTGRRMDSPVNREAHDSNVTWQRSRKVLSRFAGVGIRRGIRVCGGSMETE